MTLEEQIACQEDWFNRNNYYFEAGFADPDLWESRVKRPRYIRGVTIITVSSPILPIFVSPDGIDNFPF